MNTQISTSIGDVVGATAKTAQVGIDPEVLKSKFTKTAEIQPPDDWDDENDDPTGMDKVSDEFDISLNDVASLQFSEDIKILLINTVEMRLICYFLGLASPKDIQTAVYRHVTLIGQLNQQCLHKYMAKEYDFAGEIYFDQNGQPTPVMKQSWSISGKEISFTSTGYLFFQHKSKDKAKNVVILNWTDAQSALAGMTVYSHTTARSKSLVEKLEQYTKKNNCVRGCKLRDVNMAQGTFTEIQVDKKYDWNNYYFPMHVRQMFELEVFGFLRSTERYNAVGINKRGLLMYGAPGTGKTSLGYILCNCVPESTIIWITPDLIAENNTGKQSVKLLYMLADFVSPSVIFLEDLDLFSEDREGVVDHLSLGALMNILDGVNAVKNSVTIATTNRLELIEKALSNRPGRFDRVVEIPCVSDKLRIKMFTDRLKSCKVDEGVISSIVGFSDGWTGAECQEFINSLNLYFINKNQDKTRHVTSEVVNDVHKIVTSLSRQSKKRSMGFSQE